MRSAIAQRNQLCASGNPQRHKAERLPVLVNMQQSIAPTVHKTAKAIHSSNTSYGTALVMAPVNGASAAAGMNATW